MAGKLNDRQRAEIVMKLVNGASQTSLAKEYGVSRPTIKKVLDSNPETLQKVAQKKEENVKSILDFMDTMKGDACKMLRAIIECMNDPEVMKKATFSQLATGFGIIVDKFTQREQPTPDSTAANNLLEALAGVNVSKGAFDEVSDLQ